MHPEEAHIVQQLQAGDSQALKRLYADYSGALFIAINRVLQDEAASEDVLQEAFVKIWNNRSKYDAAKASLYTWMMNICRNLAIDKTRSKHFKRRNNIQAPEDVVHQMGITHTDTDHIGVQTLTEQLAPEQKELIDLVYFGGYTQKEAAEQLNLPLGTVKTRIRKGIQIMRKYFDL